jgi:hypothetical protein
MRDKLGRFTKNRPKGVKCTNLDGEQDLHADPSCWIAPNGDIYLVNDNGGSHNRAAAIIKGRDYGGMSDLEEDGWLHISYSSIFTGYDVKLQREHLPKQAQIDAVFDIAQAAEKRRPGNVITERFNRWLQKQQEEVAS